AIGSLGPLQHRLGVRRLQRRRTLEVAERGKELVRLDYRRARPRLLVKEAVWHVRGGELLAAVAQFLRFLQELIAMLLQPIGRAEEYDCGWRALLEEKGGR